MGKAIVLVVLIMLAVGLVGVNVVMSGIMM